MAGTDGADDDDDDDDDDGGGNGDDEVDIEVEVVEYAADIAVPNRETQLVEIDLE